MDWYQETQPDPEITYNNQTEYPIATLTKSDGGRVQIIAENLQWWPVILEGGKYRDLTPEEWTATVQASVDWAYNETIPPEDILAGLGGEVNYVGSPTE